MTKWPQRNPLGYLFQWIGWNSTLSSSAITFYEREPFLRGVLCGSLGPLWSQKCMWNMWKKFQMFSTLFGDFPRMATFITLSNLLSGKDATPSIQLQKPPGHKTRWSGDLMNDLMKFVCSQPVGLIQVRKKLDISDGQCQKSVLTDFTLHAKCDFIQCPNICDLVLHLF